jgi:hypothetical protein
MLGDSSLWVVRAEGCSFYVPMSALDGWGILAE